nr:MAG TPA: hypothetical protein [Caudoviricetes sp.]
MSKQRISTCAYIIACKTKKEKNIPRSTLKHSA